MVDLCLCVGWPIVCVRVYQPVVGGFVHVVSSCRDMCSADMWLDLATLNTSHSWWIYIAGDDEVIAVGVIVGVADNVRNVKVLKIGGNYAVMLSMDLYRMAGGITCDFGPMCLISWHGNLAVTTRACCCLMSRLHF